MSGIQETNNKSWLKLVFMCICVFVHRNKSKRLPVLTVPSLSFILGGIPIAERGKGGIMELQAIQKELYVTEVYFIFFHIYEWVVITDMLILFVVVTTYYNALFPHKININVCAFICLFPYVWLHWEYVSSRSLICQGLQNRCKLTPVAPMWSWGTLYKTRAIRS